MNNVLDPFSQMCYVPITQDDISAVHPLGAPGDGPRPGIVP